MECMREFLRDGPLWIHPTAYMPLSDFFAYYKIFCIEHYGREPIGTRYTEVWREFGLATTHKITKVYPMDSNTHVRGRYIMGVTAAMSNQHDDDRMDVIGRGNDMWVDRDILLYSNLSQANTRHA